VQVVFHSAKCEAPFGGTGLLATRRVSRSPVTSAAPGQPAIQSPPSWSAKPNTRSAPPLSTGRLARRVGAALPIVGERKSDRQSPPTYAIGEPLSGRFAIACLRTCCVPPTRHELRREQTRRQRVGCQNSDRRLRMGRFTGGTEFWHPHKVRGALLVACAQAGVPCAEYPPGDCEAGRVRVGCKNSMRAPRNLRFAGRTVIFAPQQGLREDLALWGAGSAGKVHPVLPAHPAWILEWRFWHSTAMSG
jgi:hypothetical protein